jgi:hypothetical protein
MCSMRQSTTKNGRDWLSMLKSRKAMCVFPPFTNGLNAADNN